MQLEEAIKIKEDLEVEAEGEEGSKLCVTIVTNQDTLLRTTRIPVQHLDIVTRLTMLSKNSLNY